SSCDSPSVLSFFFNHPAPTSIYTLSLHDALPIFSVDRRVVAFTFGVTALTAVAVGTVPALWAARIDVNKVLKGAGWGSRRGTGRSEEHTSELQSRSDLVCRLLLEKKK